LHPITLRIYNADHEADYANGFEPDVKIEELVIGNDLLPFGDTNERLLSEALSRISGLKSLPVHAESEGRILLTPSSLERKQTKGLIFEEGK
jgi:carboxyl-terminal processing protease